MKPLRKHKGRHLSVVLSMMVAVVASGPSFVWAAETDRFGFAPTEGGTAFHLPLQPGAAVRDSVRVFNKTNDKIRMRIFGADVSKSADGTLSVSEYGPQVAAGTWIRPDATRVTLRAHEEKIIEFAVVIPASATKPLGIGAIVAQEVEPSSQPDGIDIKTRVAILIQVLAGRGRVPPILMLKNVDLRVPLQFFPSRGQVTGLSVNGTARPLEVRAAASVNTLTGRKFALPEVSFTLGPGERRKIVMVWESVPRGGGVMKAKMTLSERRSAVTLETPRLLVVPLWLLAVLVLAGTYVLRRSRRKARA